MRPPKIAIIDYRMSNLFSIKNALDVLGINGIITSNSKEILSSDGAILPGVGSYPEAVKHLHQLELFEIIIEFIATGKPFMGICLGLQLLFSKSEEFGITKGLNLVKGSVRSFESQSQIDTVPHVGWNKILINQDNTKHQNNPFCKFEREEYFYFVHSFYVQPESSSVVSTNTEYDGFEFCSSIIKDNIFASQFHPEKSGEKGLIILQEFFLNQDRL